MAFEIERKFLVDAKKVVKLKLTGGERISQGYLAIDKNKIVRVRAKKNQGYLTIKSANVGIVRQEFEYEIPINDAEELLKLCAPYILRKVRYKVDYAGHVWEVDIFEGKHAGLILAEVEINSLDEYVKIPDWVGEEVSKDPRYFNSNLVLSE